MTTAYDVVAYPGFPFAQTHPDRLATIATLMGMRPAPIERCRVLELACGDGGNLIPMAVELPRSHFVGVDLAKKPIASGKRAIADLGLTNITLKAGDLAKVNRRWGEFDFIIAHGIYAWAPPAVQDHILRIARENLAPQGVAFVSYNAFPGARLRQMIRDMLLYRTREIHDPGERASAALAMIQFLSAAAAKPDEYNQFLSKELEHMSEREIWALFHDEMGEVYSPVYFHEFVAHACRHRLQYVAEANYHELNELALTEEMRETFAAMADGWLDREQYLDFVKCRRFRQTLLCHADVPLNRQPSPALCRELWASSSAHAVSEEPDFTSGVPEEFKGPHGSGMKTAHPVAKLALAQLIANWPASVSFDDLNTATRAHADSGEDLERILFIMFSAGLIELHSYSAPAVPAPGLRPRAWRMARYQAEGHLEAGRGKGSFLTSLRHGSVQASGRIELEVVRLLNGRRDHKQLVEALRTLFDDSISSRQLTKELESSLQQLARSGLLDR
jgi:methyltransferase-like protein/ubiquinone/menaquinone biosynthesis C-methylase UbiE